MACDALIFGTPAGVLSATFTGNAEAIRHEVGTPNGLQCDCERVLRSTGQVTLSTDTLGNGGPVAIAAAGFTFVGVAVCTSRETTYSREAFVQDSATYELIPSDIACSGMEATEGLNPTGCPVGWSTDSALQNGTYSETIELLKHEDTFGTGIGGSPLLRINAAFVLRHRLSLNATLDVDPTTWDQLTILEGSATNYSDIPGCRVQIILSSADGNRSNTAVGIVTSCEMTKNREGFASYSISIESQQCSNE